MVFVFMVWGGVSIAEWVLLGLPFLRSWRRPISCVLLLALAVISGLVLGRQLDVGGVLFAYFGSYRALQLLRLVADRGHSQYLLRNARLSSFVLAGMQLIALGLMAVNKSWTTGLWYLLASMQLAGAALLLMSALRQRRASQPPEALEKYTGRDLPTLTVAIPARNETEDLNACLQSLVASNYPKLEILVLDDCSQNKHTPEIIRQFAQAGVRFIAGKAPPERWLAKNYAYQQLSAAASGDILLFCGVDVRFEVQSLQKIVACLLQKQKTMLSLAPRNRLQLSQKFGQSVLLQSARYAWEVTLPRRWLQRPPVLSTCWLIRRELLEASGGFAAVSHSISPESYFARQAIAHHDAYSFLYSNAEIGLTSSKGLAEQTATAVRVRYPQLHRRPELVSLVGLAELAICVLPYPIAIMSVFERQWLIAVVAVLDCLILTKLYTVVIDFTYRTFLTASLWLMPLAALYDVALLHYSMWQYEFGEVLWKGRNICLPVMQMTPVVAPQSKPAKNDH